MSTTRSWYPKADTALGHQHRVIAFGRHLVDGVPHVGWREKLSLLDVDRLARARSGDQEIGLTRQKRGNLKDVGHGRGSRGMRWFMNVGQDRQARSVADLGQHLHSGVEARTAERRAGGPVRFVVRGLEDHGHATVPGGVADGQCRVDRVLGALDHARTSDEDKGVPTADRERPDLDRIHGPILPVGPLCGFFRDLDQAGLCRDTLGLPG